MRFPSIWGRQPRNEIFWRNHLLRFWDLTLKCLLTKRNTANWMNAMGLGVFNWIPAPWTQKLARPVQRLFASLAWPSSVTLLILQSMKAAIHSWQPTVEKNRMMIDDTVPRSTVQPASVEGHSQDEQSQQNESILVPHIHSLISVIHCSDRFQSYQAGVPNFLYVEYLL